HPYINGACLRSVRPDKPGGFQAHSDLQWDGLTLRQALGPAAKSPGHSATAASAPVALLVAQIRQYVRLLVPYWRRASAPSVHLVIVRRALRGCAAVRLWNSLLLGNDGQSCPVGIRICGWVSR